MSASPAQLPLASVFIGNIGNVLEWYAAALVSFLVTFSATQPTARATSTERVWS